MKINVMWNCKKKVSLIVATLLGVMTAQQAMAAIALDRTRVIVNGSEKSVSLNITNENKN